MAVAARVARAVSVLALVAASGCPGGTSTTANTPDAGTAPTDKVAAQAKVDPAAEANLILAYRELTSLQNQEPLPIWIQAIAVKGSLRDAAWAGKFGDHFARDVVRKELVDATKLKRVTPAEYAVWRAFTGRSVPGPEQIDKIQRTLMGDGSNPDPDRAWKIALYVVLSDLRHFTDTGEAPGPFDRAFDWDANIGAMKGEFDVVVAGWAKIRPEYHDRNNFYHNQITQLQRCRLHRSGFRDNDWWLELPEDPTK